MSSDHIASTLANGVEEDIIVIDLTEREGDEILIHLLMEKVQYRQSSNKKERYCQSLYGTFRCQKDFLRRATPFDTGVLGCQKVSWGVERCRKVSVAILEFLKKKLTPTFCVKLLFTR